MAIRSKWCSTIGQKALITKDSFDTILPTVEVVTNSKTVIYSVRILIVALALIMGYMQTRSHSKEASVIERQLHIEKAIPDKFSK